MTPGLALACQPFHFIGASGSDASRAMETKMTSRELSSHLSASGQRNRIISITGLVTVFAIALLVGSESLFTFFALAWAVSSQTHAAPIFSYFLFGLSAAAALLATGFLTRMAWQSETDPANH
ncbi:MAG: hypothetical protein DHS20C06_20700 [Hyphobacterium sp.]|nr:MAG: hypothetical protein DHS20C06_20700 [Hyphobacterium sp.]